MKKGIKILIVEDEEDVTFYLSIVLKELCRDILFAKNGADAIELAQKNADIDLILMDINMPEMDGFEATKRIREFNKNIPIIAQTAYALSHDKEKILASGFDNYISKPFNKNTLLETIKSLNI
ncbi:hypothetical protein BZG02_13370 [Labilibaculum filiforme]|uniref:Response regulatory domain-containing protein n=1 Tax=Labilibaculum filiforme TaxID=1940526 RepID=A0A2N3HW77_9BACT|nr:response regulator [Labilibaculum filiforme]PKQ62297.1 hypothetical protein BZG02_13370 [Labilibaculum filiforme]